jgi:hypothetical protein
MRLSEICEKVTNELPEELNKNLITVELDGFAIGLKARKWNFFNGGHHQLFLLGGDSNYTTLFGLNKEYNEKVSHVANKLKIKYANVGPINLSFFEFRGNIRAKGIIGDHFYKFREYLAEYREKVD